MKRIPVTIVTGFLGSGKTTLIRHVLSEAHGVRFALIINEFGELGVDRETLAGCGADACHPEDMVELSNGCICCTVAEDFIPTMLKLIERDDPVDHIIIETSGLALPQPLVRAFNWPEIKASVSIDGIITLVDAAALAAGRFAADEDAVATQRQADQMLDHETPLGELFRDQLVCADLVVVNKADLVEPARLVLIDEQLRAHVRAGTGLIHASHGGIDLMAILGLGLGSEDDLSGRESLHELDHGGEGHEHDDFDSISVMLPPCKDKAQLLGRLETAIRTHDILRLKGFAAIEGAPARLAIQAVGPRIETYFDREWQEGEDQVTSLVVIGQSPFDREGVQAGLGSTGPA